MLAIHQVLVKCEYSQLREANGAHRPYDHEPDQAAGSDDSAQHGDIVCLGAMGERAHAHNVY
jgi:hypothetical protein